jgi:hypothetical protein
VVVDHVDRAPPLDEKLLEPKMSYVSVLKTSNWPGWVTFLLLSGPAESLAGDQRVATLIMNDMLVATAVESYGGSILEGPAEAPTGPRMIARHGDGAVFEHIELSQP